LEHPLDAGIHFLFLDEFASRDLVDTRLNLLLEPLTENSLPRLRFAS
jgi:hypothetical protein